MVAAGVVAEARVEVAAVVVVTTAVVLVSLLTLYRPAATVLQGDQAQMEKSKSLVFLDANIE